MGNQPALDGLRALAVVAVLCYHGGFSWMDGGFFGVEVFFVISGFLITTLLLEEQLRTRGIRFGAFWLRRARRLLPALATLLVVVGLYVWWFGSPTQAAQMRTDYPWSIFYAANWGQIFAGVPYFGTVTPAPLRNLWSLGVEEQWYLIWPLAFVGLMRLRTTRVRRGVLLLGISGFVMLVSAVVAHGTLGPSAINFLYLSTFTRSSGLLLGAALAFLWRPWTRTANPAVTRRARRRRDRQTSIVLDVIGAVALGGLLWAFVIGHVTSPITYRWLLPLVTVLSAVLIAVVVHPRAVGMRDVFGSRPMVAIGRRSYGLYLWSWPIAVFVDAYSGSWPRFLLCLALTIPASELCYRHIETPIRSGTWSWRRATVGPFRTPALLGGSALAVVVLLVPMGTYIAAARPVDRAQGGADAAFALPASRSPVAATPRNLGRNTTSNTSNPPAPVTAPALPRRLVIVGDSMAHSLAVNLPTGIGGTFQVTDGSVEGCSVYGDGVIRSARAGFAWSFSNCRNWAQHWSSAASTSHAQVAVVVLGAWDVFDVNVDGHTIPFGSRAADERFRSGLQTGIDALRAAGTHVALLQVACMRPQDVKGEGTPALPERADDARVAHLNDLLRETAAADPAHVTFVAGPAQFCDDPAIATNLAYRWDGVHVYKPGANLIYETIAPALLAIPLGSG